MPLGIKIPGAGPGTGPIIPAALHSVGVADYKHRYAAERLAVGAFGQWADAGPRAVPLEPAGSSVGTLTVAEESGLRFVRLDNGLSGFADIRHAIDTSVELPNRAYTMAVVGRKPSSTGTDIMGGYAGTRMARPGNGSFRTETIGTGASGTNAAVNGLGLGAWNLLMVESEPGVAGIARLNGTEASQATWTPATNNGGLYFQVQGYSAGTDSQFDIAEVIVWPRALSLTERNAVRTALRARYSVLP